MIQTTFKKIQTIEPKTITGIHNTHLLINCIKIQTEFPTRITSDAFRIYLNLRFAKQLWSGKII